MPRILVVDDDPAVRAGLRVNLGRAGHEVRFARTGEEALAVLAEHPVDLVLTDVRMPGMDGLALLGELRARWPRLPVIVMTGFGSIEDAVAAMHAGAAHYVVKPVRRDELLLNIERALDHRRLADEVDRLRTAMGRAPAETEIIGTTPPMRAVMRLVEAVADSDAIVLVTGPTGTGKELVARAVHRLSPRRDGPFVGVNCGALPETLLETELFGHEKGAFTGAVRRHRGKFEQAHGGTLFLDEVGELPPSAQVRLLRVVETGELQRVGGRETVAVDVRIVAATNRDLRREVAEGRFREDLFYRLNVFHIPVPPLRERREDIPLLVEHFIERFARAYGRPARRVSPAVLRRLLRHDWPGNVRELQHVIERAVILSTGEVITEVGLPEEAPPAPPEPEEVGSLVDALAEYERRLIVDALRREGGVQARAARRLGVSRSNLNYRIKKLGIRVRDIVYE